MSTPAGIVETLQPQLITIPAGAFLMGTSEAEAARAAVPVADNELPPHRVFVEAFYLSALQVTNAEYARFLAATSNTPPPHWNEADFSDPRQPVVAVSWFEAVTYCEWLSAQTGRTYRLPTEAEWERAARGGSESKLFPWGDDPPQSRPNYAERWLRGPEPVATAAPNAYGLLDMCENVHEWCSDWFSADYYAASPERNPQGSPAGERRSSRGGSWRHHVKISRCAARSSIPPSFQYADYGFRVACSL
jgi:formylglycine-generating enzyme